MSLKTLRELYFRAQNYCCCSSAPWPLLSAIINAIGKLEDTTVDSVTIDKTVTVDPGQPAYVVNQGTAKNVKLEFGIPQGIPGVNSVEVGETLTLDPGSDAYVRNVGDYDHLNLEFGVPQGPVGLQGPQGPQGDPVMFDTVLDMIASPILEEGYICGTLGFHAKGDGGAAYYTVQAEQTPNEMDVISLANGYFAVLVVTEPYVTPEMFGAYGDGETNDTQAILKAFSHKNVRMHANTYIMDGTAYEIDHDLFVQGCDTVIKSGSNENIGLFNFSPTSGSIRISINHVSFDGALKSSSGIYIRHEADNADIDYNLNVNVENCHFSNVQNYSSSTSAEEISVYSGVANLEVANCTFDTSCKKIDNDSVNACRFITASHVNGMSKISDCVFGELVSGNDTYLDFDCICIKSEKPDASAIIDNCKFTHTRNRFIKVQGVHCTITNNVFTHSNGRMGYMVDCQNNGSVVSPLIFECNTVILSNLINYSGSANINLFDLANTSGKSIIANNDVTLSGTAVTDFIVIASRSSTYPVRIDVHDNTIVNDSTMSRLIRDYVTSDNGLYINVSGNSLNADVILFVNALATLTAGQIVISGNVYNGSTKGNVSINNVSGATFKNIYLDNNARWNDTMPYAAFDLKAADLCKFVFTGTESGITNIPSSMSGITFSLSAIEIVKGSNSTQIKVMEQNGTSHYAVVSV